MSSRRVTGACDKYVLVMKTASSELSMTADDVGGAVRLE